MHAVDLDSEPGTDSARAVTCASKGGLAAGLAIGKLAPRPTAWWPSTILTAVGVIKGLEGRCRVSADISVRDSTIRD